jgi:branched-chain amino acid transport system substrate-binding protein
VQEAKIVQMNGGSTGTSLIDPEKYPYTFRTVFTNEMMAAEMVDYAIKVRGWKRVAILHDKTALGVGGGADLQRFVKEADQEPVIIESFNAGETDLAPQVKRIREARPEVMLSWALGADTAAVLKAMAKLNYDVPYVGYAGALLKTTRDLAGDAIGDAMAVNPARFVWADDPSQVDPLVMEFIEAREGKFGADDRISLSPAATHYDAMMLLAEAMARAGATDSNAVKAALETIKDYKGIATDYSYGPSDHEGFAPGGMKPVLIGQEWKGTFKLAPSR